MLLVFSVKDACTRMVLHRCESPGDLYLVGWSSRLHHTPYLVLSPPASILGMLASVILAPPHFVKYCGVFPFHVIKWLLILVKRVAWANKFIYHLARLPQLRHFPFS
jgi:hypothetical protein